MGIMKRLKSMTEYEKSLKSFENQLKTAEEVMQQQLAVDNSLLPD